MEGGDFMDDIGNLDFRGDLFDHIDDLLDFPCEDIQGEIIVGGGGSGGGCSGAVGSNLNGGFQGVWQAPQDGLSASPSLFSNPINNSGFPTDLPVPDEDIAQLEWLSTFVEDSFSPGSVTFNEYLDSNKNDNDENKNKNSNNENKNINIDSEDTHRFQTPSPVSVLESSSSCSGGRTMPISPETVVPGRARTKRPRPTTFNHRPVISLVSPTSSVTDPSPMSSSLESVSEFENFAESNPSTKLSKPPSTEQKKRKKKRLAPTSSSMEQSVLPLPMAVRKCLHCEITKTPQWRAGPLGPKTLCNACGVRYKSGRLFPEYRPAASPTFVPKLHSNSHKKVLEMRGTTGSKMANDDEDDEAAVTEFVPGNRLWDAYM
ncbi:hypothetical protein AQUCO_03000151v1 [Aquilegia coerulea]|uniref:GATA-type domain-containing protein n=1 Tax=Aquilegia coerulea TaxID=218851 RepID=A0A2G5D1H6_AQUCA|nr:hypothetical protein AQUCO_03000151v1 [Aquilegia coerulea]PIA37354.1 hypothetical protein AQUCO_03000151v1 [Aquilegia coerulea]